MNQEFSETKEPEAISVAEMARRLQISRSRLYQLITEGFFLPPIYDIESRRPFYYGQMIQKNIEARRRTASVPTETWNLEPADPRNRTSCAPW